MAFAEVEAAGLEEWLAELREDLRAKTYRPRPVRRAMIPKPGGSQRPLGIPTIRDRVGQTAAKLVVEPIFEADLDEGPMATAPDEVGPTRSRKCTSSSAGATPTWWAPICRSTSTPARSILYSPGGCIRRSHRRLTPTNV